MKIIIPYGIRLNADGRIDVMPVVEARIGLEKRPQSFFGIFLIDSGATTTLLPATDAEALGLTLESGKRVTVRGVAGRPLIGYRHEVRLDILGYMLDRVPVIFTKKRDAPRILGREGFFSHFCIVFDERNRRIALLDSQTEQTAINPLFFIKGLPSVK